MIVGIVSDTHGHLEFTHPAVRMLASFAVEQVLHCGDIGTPAIVDCFEAWPTHFVLGNCDSDDARWRQVIEGAGQTFHGRFGELELAGRRIALLHGDDGRKFQDTIASGQFDLVCYGHTHLAEQHRAGKTLVLNPGALFRANPHSLAIADLRTMEVTHVNL